MRILDAFLLTGCLFGQTFQGGIRGTVADTGGALVPEAKVALVDEATNLQRVTLTSDTGEFVFSAVNPATYRVVIESRDSRGWREEAWWSTRRSFSISS